MAKRTFQIYRYNPDTDAKPYMQTIEVELDGSERMLLDVLTKLKALDPTFSYRRSCREGICGSDAMNINGKNGLACLVNMRTLPDTIVLKPLPGLPVVRDLIVDMTLFFKQYHSIKPYLVNETRPPEKERLQSPEERDELNGLYECILCAAPPVARCSGGILTSSSALLACCKPTVSSPTAAMNPPPNVWTIWKILIGCSVAPPS